MASPITPFIPPSATTESPTDPAEEDSKSTDTDTVDTIKENPFDTGESKRLFDAIDKLQSCGISQDLPVPQLVIVGGQSTGKSSLLQSLTDIPFSVGAGCCTRFATRIVSKRTGPSTANRFKITIVEPEVRIEDFQYREDGLYKDYVQAGDALGGEEFKKIVEEVSTSYMGIKKGTGIDKKNFATQVLRIELSGPLRSHFSILDLPGVFTNPHEANRNEMHGIERMVIEYMKKPENIVICVADAMTDLANQGIFNLAAENVDRARLVGVFTKCDMASNPEEIVSISTGAPNYAGKSMQESWFVVRNQSDKEDKSLDISRAEAQLFSKAPWQEIPEKRRGSTMLRRYLSNLLCRRIRDNFPGIQIQISGLLEKAQKWREALGNPRPTHYDRLQYLKDVVRQYENMAFRALERPGLLSEELRVRGKVRIANEKFTTSMRESGHKHQFEQPEVDPVELLAHTTRERQGRREANSDAHHLPSSELLTFNFGNQAPLTPPPSTSKNTPKGRLATPRTSLFGAVRSEASKALFDDIRTELRAFQSTLLPGLVHPEVMPVLFQKQTENWESMAEAHVNSVAEDVATAAKSILKSVCLSAQSTNDLHDGLYNVLKVFYNTSLEAALSELRAFCHSERFNLLQTTDPRFNERLKALQTIRLLRAMDHLPHDHRDINSSTIYDHLHFSIENNMVNAVHDILKVYYQIAIESFIRHVTHNIVEGFVCNTKGLMKGLSVDWVYSLDEATVEKLSREDEGVISKRQECMAWIAKLQEAHQIVELTGP